MMCWDSCDYDAGAMPSEKTSATPSKAARRVFLHIGLPKTGTTSLQELMWHHRNVLAARGLLYPGEDEAAQHRAAMDVHAQRYRQWDEPGVAGSWSRLVESVASWPGDAVFSSELLAAASPEEARRVTSGFDAEIHVVCTARDFARQVPSVWQENVKTRHTTGFTELLDAVRAPELTHTGRVFWDYQDLPRVLRTWGESLPPDRVHVVTVPRGGASTRVLWERFAGVLGLDPDVLDTDVDRRNHSLGHVETELLRRVNAALGDDVDWPHYAAAVKDDLAATILARRRSPRPRLPVDAHDWAAHTARRFVEEITAAGYDVVGDLDDLLPDPADEQPYREVTDAQLLEVAVDTLARLVSRTPEEPEPAPERSRPGWSAVVAAARTAVSASPAAEAARRVYRRVTTRRTG